MSCDVIKMKTCFKSACLTRGLLRSVVFLHMYNEIVYKIAFLSIPSFSLSGISRWVDQTRFVTDFDYFFFQTDSFSTDSSSISSILVFGTNVSRRLPFITLPAIFPKISTATHGKRTKSKIFSNPQSWPAWMTNSENGKSLLFSNIPNDVGLRLPRGDWLIERSVWVTQFNFADF